MKLNKFLLSAIAAASLTACSDSPDVVKNDKGHWNADGTGYVSLSISMPDNVGSKGTRADGSANGNHNDNFNDGKLNEYAVYDAMLVIFTTDKTNNPKEGDYTFKAAYSLPLKFNNTAEGSQISSKAVAEIDAFEATDAKALVILNSTDKIKIEGNNSLSIDGTPFTGNFSDFQLKKVSLPTTLENNKGFVMTNAPLTTAKSVSGAEASAPTGETTTLAKLKMGNVKPTAQEALENPAATIYVERTVAKVTMKEGTNLTNKVLTADPNIKFEIKGYALDNTNPTSYIVRNADQTTADQNPWSKLKSHSAAVTSLEDQYRFVGYKAVGTNLYRTYWAKDPNYNADATNLITNSTTNPATFIDLKDASYCMENTFDVARQTQKNTTRAIVKAQLWKGDNQGKTYYMYNDDITTFNDNESTNANNFTVEAIKAVNNIPAVKNYKNGVRGLEFTNKDPEGHVQIKKVTFEDGTFEEVQAVGTSNTPIFKMIHDHFGNISVFTEGIVYYNVLIKHFGDDLTPWNEKDSKKEWNTTQPSTTKIYPGTDDERDANYLGRYGVVRNNWYELSINSIKKPGSPVINSPSNTPDDELDSYISVSINILSWAKRSQDVDLQ